MKRAVGIVAGVLGTFGVTALACSSSGVESSSTDGGGTDGGRLDGSGSVDGGPSPDLCPIPTRVAESSLAWKPPRAPKPDACSDADLAFMGSFLSSNPEASTDAFEAALKARSASCHACVFTDAAESTWGPAPKAGTTLVTINIGACYAILSGNEACGKAMQQEFDCEFLACNDADNNGRPDCTTPTELDGCRARAQKGTACKPYFDAIQGACAGVDTSLDAKCGGLLESIRVQCVGVPDGGTDGG